MYYKIVEKFGPQDGAKWTSYLEWISLNLTSFDSVDGLLKPDLFAPKSDSDWQNCINENFKLNIITNKEYARGKLKQYDNALLVGVEIEIDEKYEQKEKLLGFDIIDGYCDVSLLTNWGADEAGIINKHIMNNGLLGNLDISLTIRNLLRNEYSDDPHAQSCEVWAIYGVDT